MRATKSRFKPRPRVETPTPSAIDGPVDAYTEAIPYPAEPTIAESESRPILGIALLLLGTTIFPIQDVIIKSLSDGYAVHQIVVLRGLLALPIIAAVVRVETKSWRLKIGSWKLQLTRSAAMFTSYMVYYMALATIGLAETAAVTFSTPIFVVILAAVLLGERVGPPRWIAVAVGLLGVLVIVRPGAGVFEPAIVLALLAAIAYAVGIILTRRLGPTTNGATLAMISMIFFIVAGSAAALIFTRFDPAGAHPSLAFLYRSWVTPSGREWLMLIGIGAISGVGFFALSQAYRLAEASVVTPFEYTFLPWSVLWGWVFFGALPDVWTWVGLVLIVGAGLGIVYRESQLYRDRGRRRLLRRGLGPLRQR